MTGTTPNLGLTTYDPITDAGENFLDYRTDMAGTAAASNVQKIDTAVGDNATDITALQAKKNIIKVDATLFSPNLYNATVSGYATYSADDVIDLVLDTDSDATVTLNINALGIKSVMKINSSGTPVNLDNTNLLADRHYLFSYDGTRWIWIGATSTDQLDIGGTSGNFISIASDGSMEDSTNKATDFVTKALFDANTIIAADSDDTPAALTVAEQTLVGRITAGNIDALTDTEVRTLLGLATGDSPEFAGLTLTQIFYTSATELTISSDAITVTQSAHKLQPQSGTTDELATINGTVDGENGVFFVADEGTDTITIKHGTGNIDILGGSDLPFSNGAVFWYSDGTTVYISGGGGTDASAHIAASAEVHGLPADVNVLGSRDAAAQYVQAGVSTTGATKTGSTFEILTATDSVTFSVAFNSAPRVFCTVTGGLYAYISIGTISTTGFDSRGAGRDTGIASTAYNYLAIGN